MKKSKGYLIKQLEDEWILLPVGEKTETVHEVYEDVEAVVQLLKAKEILL